MWGGWNSKGKVIKIVHINMSHIKTITDPIIWVLHGVGGAQWSHSDGILHKTVPLDYNRLYIGLSYVEWMEYGVNL